MCSHSTRPFRVAILCLSVVMHVTTVEPSGNVLQQTCWKCLLSLQWIRDLDTNS